MGGGKKKGSSSNNNNNNNNNSNGGKDVYVDLNPSEIYFTFSKISDTFSGCSKTLSDTLKQLADGEVDASRDIPSIAVVEIDKPSAKKGGGDDDDEDSDEDSDEDERRGGNRKKKKNKKKEKDEKIFVSMNNRRLWVFKEAEKRGILETIRVRLQPKEVGERLARKGSRNFRLDRICLEARIVAEKMTSTTVTVVEEAASLAEE
jgi:ABC-type Zn2+ transport system substrate-binding protein/surface adhesin